MTSTDTPTICANCGRDIIWSAPEPGDGHGYWKHTGATESGFLFCYSVTGANRLNPGRQRATPAPGAEHTAPAEAAAETAATTYARRRGAQLVADYYGHQGRGGIMSPGFNRGEWIGSAVAILAELLGPELAELAHQPARDCEDCQTTAGCRCNADNR